MPLIRLPGKEQCIRSDPNQFFKHGECTINMSVMNNKLSGIINSAWNTIEVIDFNMLLLNALTSGLFSFLMGKVGTAVGVLRSQENEFKVPD